MEMPFSDLRGKTLRKIVVKKEFWRDGPIDEIEFLTTDNETYIMYHDQDCCEDVRIEDIAGDLENLLGSPIVIAEEVSQDGGEQQGKNSSTWTFYKLGTYYDMATIRWLGVSSGDYSEKVSFKKVEGSP